MREGLFLRPLIPKFHEPAHKDKDHDQYSFNFADGAGLSDGECPERVWGSHNMLANSTKTTGPGTLHDIYDDNFGFWNWQKYISMGKFYICGLILWSHTTVQGPTLLRKHKAAVVERNKQTEAHRGFTNSLPKGLVDGWDLMCVEWEQDSFPRTKPCPFMTEGASECSQIDHSMLSNMDCRHIRGRGSGRAGEGRGCCSEGEGYAAVAQHVGDIIYSNGP